MAESRHDGIRLFFLGFLILFLELALIRYLAGNIWNLGYFPNLVLIAVFVGMGTGFTFHHLIKEGDSPRLFHYSIYVLGFLIWFVTTFHPPIPGFSFSAGEFDGDLYFTVAPTIPAWASAALFVFWFASVVVIYFLISQNMAKVFRKLSPLKAYSLDIGGSCFGIITFMSISFLQLPGWSWFLMLIPVLLLAMPYWNRASIVVSPLLFVGMAAIAFYQDTKLLADYSRDPSFTGELEVYWSPYQKIEYVNTDSLQHRIHVNGIGHQKMEQLTTIAESYYSQIYKFREEEGKPPVKEVLILGAGSGNDVAAALQQNVDHVDAVEIDPVIGKLGLLHHPAGPYKDSRVNLVIDDGRAFMNRTKRHYDLIIFALTDSLVKVSPMAQLRLENYLFTEESFAKAYSLLEPQGDLVFYNSYRREWLVQKLKTMVMRTTGKQPIRHTKIGRDMTVLSVGDDYPVSAEPENLIAKATDDWPFFYMRERKIPRLYLYAMTGITILIIALLWFLERSTRNQRYEQGSNAKLSIKLAFLFMGVAFLLLETKSIIQFSLLFGTTWLNNSLVFLGVLVSVLIANWIATLLPKKGLWIYFALLIASCLIVFVYPLGNLLFVESGFVRFALASVMTFSPIFFANLIFAVLFREQKVAEHIFGWNLIGATLGGVIEYTSIAFGYNSLAIIVMLCYMAVLANVLVWKRQTAQAAIPTTFV